MALFEGVEYFDTVIDKWTLLTYPCNLNKLMDVMDVFKLNTVQLNAYEDRYLFYDPAAERYEVCDLRILSSRRSVIFKNVRLHHFDQNIIDDKVNQFEKNNADFDIEILKKEGETKSKKNRRRSNKKKASLKNASILQNINDDDDEEKRLNNSITTGKFFSHHR